MTLLETAIKAIIDEKLKGKGAEVYRQLYRDRNVYESGELRKLALEEIDQLSNTQLLELMERLLKANNPSSV
ncbi:hypothetical protein [Rhizobium leguminosarum]|uniref:hypothetical protein n=1 Tax=Rhizobium leguminosarum TaxID=384 RepID=UPI003D048250